MKSKIIIIGIVIAILSSVTIKLFSNKKTVEAKIFRPDSKKKVLVQVDTITLSNLEKEFAYTGTFAPFREVLLIPQVHGQVERVFFKEGDVVRKDQVLIQIDDDMLQYQHASARASFENTKRNLERHENASTGGSVSQLQLDNMRLNLETAESQLKQLWKQIEWSRLTAPFTGTITMRDAEIGSLVGSAPVARITDVSQLKLEIAVPENEINMFRESMSIAVWSDLYPGRRLAGKVDYVSERADASHNYMVKILFKNNGTAVKAGMYGRATLASSGKNNTLVMPRAALLGSAKNPQVFVLENGQALLRNVKTGNSNKDRIAVVDGLHEGDIVVTTGHINLSDGSPVSITH